MWSDQQFQEQQAAFTRSLSALEKCVDTPFIPGELQVWIEAVSAAFDQLAERLDDQREQIHSEEFREIAQEDPGLVHRVNQLREEDKAIAAEQEQIAKRIDSLKAEVKTAGRDEASLREEMNQFVEEAQQFVARARQQEVSARTWLVEAFTRERGTVD